MGCCRTACPSAPRAHNQDCQKTYDLVREAVGCMGVLGGNSSIALRDGKIVIMRVNEL